MYLEDFMILEGNEKNSRAYFKDNLYFVQLDQIYLYKRNNKWNHLVIDAL